MITPNTHTLAFIEGIGGPELLMVMVIVLVLFGGKKLPEFARSLGKSMREIKKATSGVEEEFKRALDDEPAQPMTTLPTATVPAVTSSDQPVIDKQADKPAPKPADDQPRS
jgi:TatA/E family protein of Tat protein translocase